eukprot:TRINITY_DN11479_c0_g1_i1.p1 TRINITY_DN11479_c0_g1~~TRINITY_DN11479_c0_g1_i1.p1  ORF type:complete len:262 (-),score=51.24 TRINITY_DN11479_c0_g1_i1:43-750(-)
MAERTSHDASSLANQTSKKKEGDSILRRKRGVFIVFEGPDKGGKTTQSTELHRVLNEKKLASTLLRFPDRTTPIGKILNDYLRNNSNLNDQAIHLLFSANRWEAKDKLLSSLESGTNVIVDRYAFSGVAFSAAKGVDLNWCKSSDKGLPEPDLVIYLDVSPNEAKNRGNFGEERYEKEEMQNRVSKIYLENLKDYNWEIVNANRSVEEVKKEVLDLALSCVETCNTKEVSFLWVK